MTATFWGLRRNGWAAGSGYALGILLALPGGLLAQEKGGPHLTIPQVLEHGDSGKTLLLIPCAGCGAASWNAFMQSNAHRFKMIAVTLPGYAGSPRPELPYWTDQPVFQDNAVTQISRLLEARNLTEVTVVGQSFGSLIGLLVAQANPTRVTALVNVDGSPPNSVQLAGQSQHERFRAAVATVDDNWARRLQEPEAYRQFNAAASLPTDLERLSHHGMFMASDRLSMVHYWRENMLRDVNSVFTGLSVPYLDIKAVSPRIINVDSALNAHNTTLDSVGRPTDFRQVVFHQSSHWLHVEHPSLLGDVLQDFTDENQLKDVGPFEMGEVVHRGTGDRQIILMPCLGCYWRSWERFMERNEDRFQMFAVTWPGLGDTKMPNVSQHAPTPYFDYLMLSLRHLITSKQMQRPVLVGHSAAAILAVRFAAEYPELLGGVVNVDAIVANLETHGYTPAERLAWADSEMVQVLEQFDSDSAWTRLNAPPDLPESGRGAFYSRMWLTPPRAHVLAYWRDWLRTDAGALLPDITVPFFAIHAVSADSIRATQKMDDLRRRYQLAPAPAGSRLEFIEGAGHTIWEWKPDEFDHAMRGFVSGDAERMRRARTP